MINILYMMEPEYRDEVVNALSQQEDMCITAIHNESLYVEKQLVMAETNVVLLDIDNLARNQLVRFINKLANKSIPIIGLTQKRSDPKLVELIEVGIDSLVNKEETQTIAKAIRLVQKGCFFMPVDVTQLFLEEFKEQEKTSEELFTLQLHKKGIDLTPRQLEIAYLMKKQIPNQQIADLLGITEGTIKVHIRFLYKNLGINRRKEVISMLNNLAERKEMIQ